MGAALSYIAPLNPMKLDEFDKRPKGAGYSRFEFLTQPSFR